MICVPVPSVAFKLPFLLHKRCFSVPLLIAATNLVASAAEEAHIPLRCDGRKLRETLKGKRETKGRLTAEEAITQAKIRKCPKCGKGFIKSDGCKQNSLWLRHLCLLHLPTGHQELFSLLPGSSLYT